MDTSKRRDLPLLGLVIALFVVIASYYVARQPPEYTCADNNMCGTAVTSMPERFTLPENVKPVHYNLNLTPDLINHVFTGFEDIDILIQESTDTISLNTKEIEVQSAYVTLADSTQVKATKIDSSLKDQITVFTFDQTLKAQDDTVSLHIEFTGTLNDKMAGFYRSKFTNSKGEEEFMAVTQFESTDARRAFPCWDEPALKATFSVTLNVPANRVALSNMDPVSDKAIEGTDMREVVFDQTPIMSTYLLAFIVGEFEYIESTTRNNKRVRVYTPVGRKEEGRFALEVACETLPFFAEYFDAAYPLPKVDMVCVNDFAAGAMENWGLITYRSVLLLFNPKTTAASYKQRIAYVVGHELAHQWFGNLVTMEWWTHLWLNEGFATWVGWLAVDHIFPDWKVWEQFLLNEQKRGLTLDALQSSHPIEVEVKYASEIDEIFDAISYAKGASVIRMLAAYIGLDDFRTGMRAYLKKFTYSNASTNDLWAALSVSSGKDVKSLMTSWTKQMGYPVLTVSAENQGETTQITVEQEQYLSTGRPDTAGEGLWQVPVNVLIDGVQAGSDQLLNGTIKGTFDSTIPSEAAWKLNAETAGFYRVKYDQALLPMLQKGISDKTFSVSDRTGIVNDMFALASAGYMSTTDALQVLSAYKDEDDTTVWAEIIENLGWLSSVWYAEDEQTLNRLRKFKQSMYGPLAAKLGWDIKEGEGHLTSLLRTSAIQAAGNAKVPEVVAEANTRFQKFVNGDSEAIHADLRGAVFSIVLGNGGDKEWEQLVQLTDKMETEEEKLPILKALGSGSSAALVVKTLDYSVSGEVRSQDVPFVIRSCGENPTGRDETWDYVKTNWAAFHDRFSAGNFLLGRIVTASAEGFASEKRADEVTSFFDANGTPAIERTIKQSIESIRARAAWLERDRDGLEKWLEANVSM
ncbi:hypothetical protein SARC_02972 [Sphaeroforma arctica JP610]|uniref:Aminopeptidase n=1 Tax=Sphaeroforma arctica JP610 TaxID=667725 RepID=A0A0L0G7H3_9EUKA|nr:hypothetical protein SARC_02972 [Sphaeroforma arctica JP610]KNC84831.1 hypothetical protein SARC_02972 [Sphaeroforma arctica JP610]|eukprot:XP_014158733.1 hypothetical protein SARC_02972 [Sphaeroforma arctica JP610]